MRRKIAAILLATAMLLGTAAGEPMETVNSGNTGEPSQTEGTQTPAPSGKGEGAPSESGNQPGEGGPSQNGQTQPGQTSENGQTQNDPTQNGPTQNGQTQNDLTENDPTQNGQTQNDPTQNGQTQNDPTQNDPAQGGDPVPQTDPAENQDDEPAWRPGAADEAWMESPLAEGPRYLSGSLKDILTALEDLAGGPFTVYICSQDTLTAQGFSTDDLENVRLEPDPEIFDPEKVEIRVSNENPEGGDATSDEEPILYVWAAEKGAVQDDPVDPANPTDPDDPVGPQEPGAGEPSLTVDSPAYIAGVWVNEPTVFSLSGAPEGDYTYAAIVYDERIAALSGSDFTAREEGRYSVRFALCDWIGDIVLSSDAYELMQDFTAPELFEAGMKPGSKREFELYAEDSLSGVAAYSLDGGESWVAPDENGKAWGKGKPGQEFEPGALLVRDAAGNIAALDGFMIPEPDAGGFWGGGGSGGSGEKAFVHSPAGSKKSGDAPVSRYDSVELEVSDQPMEKLTVGGEELDVLLEAEGGEDEDWTPRFTARLAAWDDSDKENTLILTLLPDDEAPEDAAYQWKMNGLACRLLYKSGVEYLAFQQGERLCALSTGGFTAGTEYTRLMRQGASASQFDYTIRLEDEEDAEDEAGPDWRVRMWVTVSQTEEDGEAREPLEFEMEDKPGAKMYYYDVSCGDEEMLRRPFGEKEEAK